MGALFEVDWQALFVPSGSLAEILIRGTAIYLGLLVLMRVMRRDAVGLSVADLLLVVLIADAAQNGLAGEYRSVTEGIVLVCTLAFWDFAVDWLAYHWPAFARLVEPPPLALVRDGRMLKRNMRQELITEAELMGKLREEGVDKLADVKSCYLESEGGVSVIRRPQAG